MENEERRMQNDRMQRANDLLERTKNLRWLYSNFCEGAPKDETSGCLAGQLPSSGTSVGANYRAAHTVQNRQLGTVFEEADESALLDSNF
jgi:hypothetical protein